MLHENLATYDYFLPKQQIAQFPLSKRSSSKLLFYCSKSQKHKHLIFSDIVDYFDKNDILVFNETKVRKARIFFQNKNNAKIEFLLLKSIDHYHWECIGKPTTKMKVGENFFLENYSLKITNKKNNFFTVCFFYNNEKLKFSQVEKFLKEYGEIPLPPYIKKEAQEKNYQTVYSQKTGSSAAPTAGLHFDEEILSKLKRKGVQFVFIDLQIGLGTFQPIKVDNINNHEMHSENYFLSDKATQILNHAKKQKKKIIAIGTTSLRAIEDNFQKNNGTFFAGEYQTNIFIKPPESPKSINGILTNFHLPKSTLFILICSILGTEETKKIYKTAVENNYRFFSFGDAMLIL